MKINIHIPPITHSQLEPDLGFSQLYETMHTFAWDLTRRIRELLQDETPITNVEEYILGLECKPSNDSFIRICYRNSVIGLAYLHYNDGNYIKAHFLVSRMEMKRLAAPTQNPEKPSEDEFIQKLRNIAVHITNGNPHGADILELQRKDVSDGINKNGHQITKILLKDRIIGLIYHGKENYYFMCNEAIKRARKLWKDDEKWLADWISVSFFY